MDKNLELRRLYTQSFDDSPAFVDYFFDRLTMPENVVSLVEDGKIVSALHLIDRTIFLRGSLFSMPFVVAAATIGDLRGKRLMERVIRDAFKRLRIEGKAFVALYPFKHSYYKKYGFVSYTRATPRTISYDPEFCLDTVPAASRDMLRIYNRFCAGKQGYVVRQTETYDELLERWATDGASAIVARKGKREVYAVFSERFDETEEVCGDFSLLASLPELDGKKYVDFDGDENEYAMTRLIDVRQVLEGIIYDADGELSFLLTDAFMPENDEAYTLQVRGSRGSLKKIQPRPGLMPVSVEQLTLWIFGQGCIDCPLLTRKKTFCIDKY